MFNWFRRRNAVPPPIDFPYPLQTVHGREAFRTFESLRLAGNDMPVILGSDDDLRRIAETIDFAKKDGLTVEGILKIAADSPFPDALRASLEAEARQYREKYPDDEYDDEEPEIGSWPFFTLPGQKEPSAPFRTLSRLPYERVHIALIPTSDRTEIPAYLYWGGWNACPEPHHHVAAARSWRDRYGAELVSMSGDVVEFRVARRPADRNEALALAREQYDYCNEMEELSGQAASLLASDWWLFWWD